MNFIAFAIRRLLPLPFVMLGVSSLVFVVSFLMPGDPVALILGNSSTPAQRAELREQLGLNEPMPVQYVKYVEGLVHGDLGTSLVTKRPVLVDLEHAIPASLELTVTALTIAVAIGIPLGVSGAMYVNRWPDYLGRILTLSGISMEKAWTAVLLQMAIIFVLVSWPITGRISGLPPPVVTNLYVVDSLLAGNVGMLGSSLQHLLFPAIALAIHPLAQIARITRAQMLEERSKDYRRACIAQGLPSWLITYKYMLRNALPVTLTVTGLSFGGMLGGAFLVESVFSWPGLGQYGVAAIRNNDLPAIAGVTLVMGVAFVTVNTLVDVLYAFINPRIRYAR